MLSIQPNFTIQKKSFKPVFRGEKEHESFWTEDRYNEEKDFYEKQIDGFNDILNEEYMPNSLKKAAKVLRIISEGILEGWAVAWGAKKGLNFMKNTTTRTLNSKNYARAKEILSPAKEGLVKVGNNLKEFGAEKLKALSEKEFVQKMTNPIKNFFENKEFGKYIAKQYNSLKEGLGTFKGKIKEQINKITFEKATNITAATLGVGSGTMGAINSAIEENNEYIEAA